MTLEEVFKLEYTILSALSNAKCDYEIALKDYGEDDFITLLAKQDMDKLLEAKSILEKERKEILSKYTPEEVDNIIAELI